MSETEARAFSQGLLRIHAAADPGALAAVTRCEEARHAATGWIVELLREHGRRRGEQLQVQAGAPAAGLTPRERQVLQRIARGDTDAAAARALGIATKTVSKHVEGILRKLGVETRTAAAQSAARQT